eukprot:gene13541-3956_t
MCHEAPCSADLFGNAMEEMATMNYSSAKKPLLVDCIMTSKLVW